ncbi:hypothetical protein N7492_006625 [Penicillium capsulatum]|uniref:GRF-type domain-containing protein n=1 Tax=Penicillium capsulatum TaxID=69766 RepID=A0A9W9I0K3_9EURO|nr:hypothetical protein N7492_006625 [Penicillium capsulatum]KAJ6116460.1 hypothetical protein N7512_006185 [Penicillium capsulatum]
MLSPSKKTPITPRNTAPLKKGLFKDGVWCCNCPKRPPAIKRQTKNNGPNHGRWFYTCQTPVPHRCGFFLWVDDAKPREKEAVLANSRSEIEPQTPSRTPRSGASGLLTPQTERRAVDFPARHAMSTPQSAKARMMLEDTDEFGWNDDSDENEELTEILSSSQQTEPLFSQPNFHSESPSKAARTAGITSPGKRKLSEFTHDPPNGISPIPTPGSSRSFSSRLPPSSAEVCMTPTPTKYRDVLSADSKPDISNLASQATALLEKDEVVLPNKTRDDLVRLLNTFESQMKSVTRSRDWSRQATKKKEEELARLKKEKDAQVQMLRGKITNLQAQHETDQKMIDSMRPS